MRFLSPISTEFGWPRHVLSPAVTGDVFEDFDHLFDGFFHPGQANASAGGFQPKCDVHESKEHFLMSFDMPGVKKEDIKIEVLGNELTISGERQREVKNVESDATLRRERVYGRFERSFTLPTTIASDKIEAHYENGVLNVALPKAEATKGRTIQIQTDHGSLWSRVLGSKKEVTPEAKDIKIS